MRSFDEQFQPIANAARIGKLIGGFITHTLSDAEQQELDEWLLTDEKNMALFAELTDDAKVAEFINWLQRRDTEAKLQAVKSDPRFQPKVRWMPYAAAAGLLIAVSVLAFYFLRNERKTNIAEAPAAKADIAPGQPAAILRMDNGKVITLEGLKDTVVDGVAIAGGVIDYAHAEEGAALHEVIIPRKGFYQLLLPDGTKVYLNNASSISYPSAFTGTTREVRVTGESYFEVAKDKAKPFIVHTGSSSVTALGTRFAVRNYDNEAAQRVVLTEGSVRVAQGSVARVLQPLQQATIMGEAVQVTALEDVYPATAWKENVFRFSHAPLEEVMNVLERWYDVEIIYKDHPSIHINATISRDVPVSKLIALLEATKEVRLTIHGNQITVQR